MSKINVLLVDDEAPFLEAMAKRLGRRSFQVTTAPDAPAALALLEGEAGDKFDVAVLDVRMPSMSGLELLSIIRAKRPLIETIMLTGHATLEDAIDGMKQGAFDYLTKPCDIQVLEEKIKDACQVKRDREARIVEANVQLIALRRGD